MQTSRKNYSLKEKDVQELFYRNPYLIDKKFINSVPTQYYKLASGFADLVIFQDTSINVIELKVIPLRKSHVLQLAHYMNEFLVEFPDKELQGFLIGKKPVEDLDGLLQTFKFQIEIKVLNRDISTEIKYCKECRMASDNERETCWNCKSNQWL